MSIPTITSAAVVAAEGIDRNKGEKNNATAKHTATTNAVRPERPPSATPDALSTYVVVVEVPNIAPISAFGVYTPSKNAKKGIFIACGVNAEVDD